jgi:hypothetical protein
VLALPYGVLARAILTVSALNQRHHGVFAVTEILSREFMDAFGAIYRVTPRNARRPYVVAPKETRDRLYAISPAFAELKGGLEGSLSQPYAALSCQAYQTCTDNDVAWGWFLWQLREAAWRLGYHENARKAARFYERVAAEINAACASGTPACGGKRSSLLPPWDGASVWALPKAFVRALVPLITFRGFQLNSAPSVGTPEQLAEFHDLTREVTARPRSERFSITGWVFSTRGSVQLSVRSGAGDFIESTHRAFSRPDVRDYVKTLGLDLPQAAESGFEVTAPCGSGCYLYARTGQGDWIKAVPIDGTVRYFQSTLAAEIARARGKNPNLVTLERGDVLMYVDIVKRADAAPDFQAKLRSWKVSILQTIGAMYQNAVPALFAVAVFLLLGRVAAWWKHRILPLPDLVVVLVLVLLCARTAALAFADLVIIRVSGDPDYANPGYPLVLFFAGLLLLDPKFRATGRRNEPRAGLPPEENPEEK